MAIEKLLPQNMEAEAGTLGSLLIDPEGVDEVADWLEPRRFYREAHREIYQAMIDLHGQGIPADLITLTDELARRGKLDDLGGISYVSSLANQVPTSANLEYYARIVDRCGILREIIQAAGQMAAVAYNEPDAEAALDQAERLIFNVRAGAKSSDTGITDLNQPISDVLEALDRMQGAENGITGLGTGLSKLDKDYTHGLHASDLIVLGARPAVGKSSLALTIAHNAARKGHGVLIFSLEMSKEQLAQRLLCMEAGIDSSKLRGGYLTDADWAKLSEAAAVLSKLPIFIDDTAGISIVQMRSRARRLMIRQKFDIIMVDYIQLAQGSSGGSDGRGYQGRRIEVGEVSRGLKQLARELRVPVLALSQLSRAVESRTDHKPQMSDLRESGDIEADADVILMLDREEVWNKDTEKPHIADLYVPKNRHGRIGQVALWFQEDQTLYRDLATNYADAQQAPIYSGYGGDEYDG